MCLPRAGNAHCQEKHYLHRFGFIAFQNQTSPSGDSCLGVDGYLGLGPVNEWYGGKSFVTAVFEAGYIAENKATLHLCSWPGRSRDNPDKLTFGPVPPGFENKTTYSMTPDTSQ